MVQKGDRFDPAAKFGPVVQFDTAETQRTLGFGENTYQGRILKNWDDALGTNPTTSLLAGLRISGFGTPALAPAPGTANASLMQYIKQIEVDLTGIKADTTALRGQLTTIATSIAAIVTSTQAIAVSTQAIAVSAAASAASSATIAAQQIQIINLLTIISNKP